MKDLGDCPVCRARGLSFFQDGGRSFLRCPCCTLVFQASGCLPGPEEEKARYEAHHNDPAQKGYKKWLEAFASRAMAFWDGKGSILDFGSGPRPVLANLLRARGYKVFHYDPFFSPRWPVEGEPFHLILLCEVLEHITRPVETLKRLYSRAGQGGLMALQTLFLPKEERPGGCEAFARWWYRQDITHIRFYNPSSLMAMAEASGWRLAEEDASSFALFEKAVQGSA